MLVESFGQFAFESGGTIFTFVIFSRGYIQVSLSFDIAVLKIIRPGPDLS